MTGDRSGSATLDGRILTPEGWLSGRVVVCEGRIAAIEPVPDLSEPLILPGFVDLHCHGGGGADIMDGGNAARTVACVDRLDFADAYAPRSTRASPCGVSGASRSY